MKILDATTGFKGIWYQKNHPFVTFMDQRKTVVNTKTKNKSFKNSRRYKINPDVVSTWKDAPFPDDYFDMIIFDPPHLVIEKGKKLSSLEMAYGCLYKDSWRRDLKEGIDKLFKILKPEGIFVFKWCENSIKIQDVLKLFPYSPMFGSNTKSKRHTQNYWILFIKYDVNMKLTEVQT